MPSDLIYREDAKDYARHAFAKGLNVIEYLDEVPAANFRPVVWGKWVNYGDEYRPDIKCCVCGQRKPILLGNFNFNFCPNCGAMLEE